MKHKIIKPYSEGWEKLSIEERIDNWIEENRGMIGDKNRVEDFKNFLWNFDASYNGLDKNSLEQLAYDLRECEHEFWTPEEKQLLRQGVFAMYNTTPALLELKNYNDEKEKHRYN
jgi:hypothetical protein